MATENALDKAYRQLQLWPQIHAAADVFVRRKAANAEPYELTWRLIHLWESVVVTLAEAATARLMTLDGREEDVRAIREKCYGRTWNKGESALEKRIGALEGSVDKWIEILDYVASIQSVDSAFLASVVAFLTSRSSDVGAGETRQDNAPIDVTRLIAAWGRACDVPVGLKAERVPVKAAFKIVNSFRNRFAHVPFPYDVIQDVFASLQECTLRLFSAPPSPLSQGGTLGGAIAYRGRLIKGATAIEHKACPSEQEPHFLFGLQKNCADEAWSAIPFVHVDEMFRPYVLTRMKDDAGLWEYTRFLAESNAVVTITNPDVFDTFPIPSEGEYAAQDAHEETGTVPEQDPMQGLETEGMQAVPEVRSISEAASAIRQRRFKPAISFLEQLVKQQPEYHVGWLKLGTARRELAVETRQTPGILHDQEDAEPTQDLLRGSLEALNRAKQHIQASYRAEAHYQASKTNYRLWQLTPRSDFLDTALEEAEAASELYPDSKYDSWMEYLLQAHESKSQSP